MVVRKTFDFSTPVEAEAYGALLGMELAIIKGQRDIALEGDSIIVINSLKYNNAPASWRIQNTITRIKDYSHRISSVEFNFIKKEANSMAHSLAAYVVQHHMTDQLFLSPPSCITHLFSEFSPSL